MPIQANTILEVKHLSISFSQYGRGFEKACIPTIRDLNISIHEREMVAVVGSSGSGKSLLAHAILGILPYNAALDGEILYCGTELTPARTKELRGNQIVLVPQSVAYLDPLLKVGAQIRKSVKTPEVMKKSQGILKRYGLEPQTEDLYPFELSGGMTRRILISTAVMGMPRLVIADEPTPGLHIDAARRVLSHFREIADEGAGVLLITHDLELALNVADRVIIFYAGTTVEDAMVEDFTEEKRLRHPYTKALFCAMPQHGFSPIPGTQPYGKDMPPGCPFAPRCGLVGQGCLTNPPLRELRGGLVRCIHAE